MVKVKELQEAEYRKPRRGQTVFGFQHFGPEPELLDAALASGATFIAFETVGQASGLPILAPMSAIAGRLAVQVGAWCLQKQNGGSGVLLPGLDGIAPGQGRHPRRRQRRRQRARTSRTASARAVTVFARTEKRIAALRARYPGVAFRDRSAARASRMPTSSSAAC